MRTASAEAESLVLVVPGGLRYPVIDAMTIGRGDEATVKLDDRTVSRLHARIAVGPDGPVLEDAGSTFGIIVAGQQLSEPQRLHAGQEIRFGNVVVNVEGVAPPRSQRSKRDAGPPAMPALPVLPDEPAAPEPVNATLVVPMNATELGLRAPAAYHRDGALRPRLRSGWALKRIDGAAEADRYVLRDLKDGSFIRMDGHDARMLELLDGKRTITELLVEVTKREGQQGPARMARLIADFGERGMIDGIAETPAPYVEPRLMARAFKSREKTFAWIPRYFQSAYRHWGKMYFSSLSVSLLILLSIAGLVVFSYLVGARYGTPLVVAHRLLLGGLVFIVGRFLIVMVHELGHGLALSHYGRSTSRAGLRLLFIFPYAFVDSSEAYFETRMHRIAISAAGPLVDFSLGALFSIACAVAPHGNVRDVFFQLAFAGYIGAFFNVNPFLDRDGYQIICEWLREPNLKASARAQLRARLSGEATAEETNPVLARYGFAGLVWSLIGAGFVAVMSLRYYSRLSALAPHSLIVGGFILFFVVLLLPVPIALGAPLLQRARYGTKEVNRAVK